MIQTLLLFKMQKILFRFFLISFISLTACKETRLGRSNMSSQYDSDQPYHLFQFALFHSGNDTTELQFRIPLHEFLYKRDHTLSEFKSEFSLTYYFYEDYRTKNIIDSATFHFTDSIFFRQLYWYDYLLPFPLGKFEQGILKIEIADRNKNSNSIFNIHFNKKDIGNRQYFYTEHKENSRIPQSILSVNDTFKIHISELLNTDSLYVGYFNHFREIALPPFSYENIKVFPWKPDSVFTISIHNKQTEFLNFRKPGIYHFMPDTILRNGYTMYLTRPDYPLISTHDLMVGPLRYISTNKEFRKIETQPDPQSAIEDFWLGITSNADVARRLIKNYYSRVQFANVFFTSYKEGWMTDRGMVYIVMGAPNIVYRSSFNEIWIYGEDGNYFSVRFEFRKVLNPLSDNDYTLMRNPTYKEKWYRAVDIWRKK